MTKVILSEKPKAALKIATALAAKFNTKIDKTSDNGVPIYEVKDGKERIIIVSAVGHLFTLKEKEDNNWTYPVFDVEWVESNKVSKASAFTKKYVSVLRRIAKDADELIIATDYDIEGEVIGLNIMRSIFKKKDAERMKFSTLTIPDLIESYENLSKHIDWGQAKAGETRHMLDWFWGINLSRALTSSIKKAGTFKILSTGRVQGPALKLLTDRENEIESFKPEPFWVLKADIETNKKEKIETIYEKEKLTSKEEAEKIYNNIKNQKSKISDVKVKKIEKNEIKQAPPYPFDLTTLQTEAYAIFKISPKETLAIAQELYTGGYISYPRTSSQELSPKIGFSKILGELKSNPNYKELCEKLLKEKYLKPNNGTKKDPAHPAIYPTGILPKKIDGRELKIYDLIVKRFMATFGDWAKRESQKIQFDIFDYIFVGKGTITRYKGWHEYYMPYVRLKEEELPILKEGDVVKLSKITNEEKQTQPPHRFNQASIIKELEKRNLGTKATRAAIVDILYKRGYVVGDKIQVTELGKDITKILEKYSPKIIDEKLTSKIEEDLEKIREEKELPESVVKNAKKILLEILEDFKKKETSVGKDLAQSNKNTKRNLDVLGKCPNCDGDLVIRFSKKTRKRFAGCSNYPKCTTTYPLPGMGLIKPTGKICEKCGTPIIMLIMKGRKPFEMCLDMNCETKKEWREQNAKNVNNKKETIVSKEKETKTPTKINSKTTKTTKSVKTTKKTK